MAFPIFLVWYFLAVLIPVYVQAKPPFSHTVYQPYKLLHTAVDDESEWRTEEFTIKNKTIHMKLGFTHDSNSEAARLLVKIHSIPDYQSNQTYDFFMEGNVSLLSSYGVGIYSSPYSHRFTEKDPSTKPIPLAHKDDILNPINGWYDEVKDQIIVMVDLDDD